MTINIFATQTGSIPLSELDTNFATPITIGSTSIALGQTATTLSGVTFASGCVFPIIPISSGGTGTATPSLVAGTNVTITGTWPNQTINATGGGSGSYLPLTGGTLTGSLTISGSSELRGSYGSGGVNTNVVIGDGALTVNSSGGDNTAIGFNALQNSSSSGANSAVGSGALQGNTSGFLNCAFGFQTLQFNNIGSRVSAFGSGALYNNTSGIKNSAFGYQSLFSNTTGGYNSAFGTSALQDSVSGSGNSAFNPLTSAGTYAPVFNPTTESNRFCMGSTSVTNAYIQVAWTVVSDARDKTNFAPIPHGLDFINKLKPTAYQFKEDRETDVPTGIVRYGFKAQDILELEGDTPVIIDTEDLDKLRFNSDSLIPVLVNAIKELTARIESLESKNV